jgi:hypothetical protein
MSSASGGNKVMSVEEGCALAAKQFSPEKSAQWCEDIMVTASSCKI